MIQIDNLQKSFGAKPVLQGVSMTIPTGSTTCVIGKSGCGKSVLLKHIVGLLRADSGSVTIDGQLVHDMSQQQLFELRRSVGFVFQGAALFDSLNVFDNIVIGLVEHGEKDKSLLDREARRVLSAVGLLPDLSESGTPTYEREYGFLASKKPSDLSGGMRKRVGVARALVGSPGYIFYDEPTTGLDPITSQQIDDLVEQLASSMDVTSVVITHDMFSVFNIADYVVMLDKGLVRFQGSVEELKASTDPVVAEFLERYI